MKIIKGLMLALCVSVATSSLGMSDEDQRAIVIWGVGIGVATNLLLMNQVRKCNGRVKALAIMLAGQQERIETEEQRVAKEEVESLLGQVKREQGIVMQLRKALAEQGGVFKKQEEARTTDRRAGEKNANVLKLALAEETAAKVRLQEQLKLQAEQAAQAA
ncbi:MAG TPA: hypothetical protein QGF02_04220 [Candidatus Babeliales bacterium]|nr:hypothetical protein [Candidatus Babeliales bacterium]